MQQALLRTGLRVIATEAQRCHEPYYQYSLLDVILTSLALSACFRMRLHQQILLFSLSTGKQAFYLLAKEQVLADRRFLHAADRQSFHCT